MTYRTLDPDRIVETLAQLRARIDERFPQSGLAHVGAGLTDVARLTKERASVIAAPNMLIRFGSGAVIVIGLLVVGYLASIIEYKHGTDNLFGVLQGIDALLNVLIAMGVAIFFLSTFESRWKRQQALAHLHELRTIVHVIDMHQLTKDPSSRGGSRTRSSPNRVMTPYELIRYLDYCSELLSLAAKVATLYAQSSRDNLVIGAVTELEQLSSNLSQKIWQKITLISDTDDASADEVADGVAIGAASETEGPGEDGGQPPAT
jgi:hypothetical protein